MTHDTHRVDHNWGKKVCCTHTLPTHLTHTRACTAHAHAHTCMHAHTNTIYIHAAVSQVTLWIWCDIYKWQVSIARMISLIEN